MRPRRRLWTVLTIVLLLATSAPGRADEAGGRASGAGGRVGEAGGTATEAGGWSTGTAAQVVEAGPEDGFLCCNGVVPFLFSGQEVLTSTGRAGVFRSETRGERWQRSMTGLVAPNGVSGLVAHVCQAASRPDVVYALAGREDGLVPFDGLFSSEDFGRTWVRRGHVPTGSGFGACSVDDVDEHTVYVVDPFGRTWRSTDGGTTFETFRVPACAAGRLVQARQGVVYVGHRHGCKYSSTDGGTTFSALAEPSASRTRAFAVSPDGHAIVVSTPDASFRSTDGGASWVPVTGLPAGAHTIAFHPTDPTRLYASDGLLYASADGGLTFTSLPASDDPRFLAGAFGLGVDDRGSLYVDTYGGPFRSDDGGATFRSLLNGFRASSVNDLALDADGKLLVAVNNTRGLFRQTSGLDHRAIGDALPRSTSGANLVTAVAGSPSDPAVVLAATSFQGGLFRTADGGRSWSPVPGAPAVLPRVRMAFPTAERAYLVAPGSSPGLYRSDDAGRSFAQLSALPLGTIAVDPTDPDVLVVGALGGNGGLFRSTDGGRTLQDLGQPGHYSALLLDRRDPQVVYAGQQSGHLLRSRDGGRSFKNASSGAMRKEGVLGLAQDVQGTLYAWTRGAGLFASRDQAYSWQAVDTGEALQRSGVQAGRSALVAHPEQPGLLYLGNAGVILVRAGG